MTRIPRSCAALTSASRSASDPYSSRTRVKSVTSYPAGPNAGNTGISHSVPTPSDWRYSSRLVTPLKSPVPSPSESWKERT